MPKPRHATTALVKIRDRLAAQPSVVTRTETASEVGALLSSEALSRSECESALAILEQLLRDSEKQVRQALAMSVRSCALLPPSLARTIAEDIEEISIPFIRVSPALLDADLLVIIASGITSKQIAVAKRDRISERVSDALVATHRRRVVTSLLENSGAALSPAAYHGILDDFSDDAGVQQLVVERGTLPLSIAERLIEIVSESLRQRLIEKHELPPELAGTLLELARERVQLQGEAARAHAHDCVTLATRLALKGKLTPTLLMRALCLGDLEFFVAAMAARAHIPLKHAATLVADEGPLGFKSLYEKSGLPGEFLRGFRAALEVWRELRQSGDAAGSTETLQLVLDRVMREYDEGCPADLEYLLSQMAHGLLGRAERNTRW